MIFFNIQEARQQLLDKGIVYTLRSSFRKVGDTTAVMGTMKENWELCRVSVSRIGTIHHPEELYPYLYHSGFINVDDWLSMAAPTARMLYKVEKL